MRHSTDRTADRLAKPWSKPPRRGRPPDPEAHQARILAHAERVAAEEGRGPPVEDESGQMLLFAFVIS